MSVNFRGVVPALEGPLDSFAQIEWIKELNQTTWLFAIVETAHLLSMVILGGAVLVLNLRLLGAILKDVPARTVEAATRPWLLAGIIGTISTGIYMGVATIVTLLPNGAFFVKMIALIAAILMSVAVSKQVREGERKEGGDRHPLGLAIASGALWLVGLVLFSATTELASGSLIVAFAGFVLFAASLARYRGAYLASLGAVVVLAVLLSLRLDAGSTALPGLAAIVLALGVAIAAGWFETRARTGPVLGRLQVAALSSSMAWITVAAAGRWIGFS
ncbi:DUF6644 family protein [Novosphingobium cyanobacteriorum]|uniref:DUF6644 domain-containing protein n=1 Tax=Novosphingobium cyanobacteriorum TaxID=3024215 RepID=A0ABT6CL95_9SPHN|nr:DUF6644 family protein [Novosphingobium cyanobacteriorum]MDF8334689.1 hypothetical protein [Novosphingobium cyanobacteriorum]